MFSAGYDIGDIPTRCSPRRPSGSSRIRSRGDRGARGLPLPDARGAQRARDRRRARARGRLRPAPGRGGVQARDAAGQARARSTPTPGCGSSSTSIGAPRTRELFLVGRNVEAAPAPSWGLVNQVVDADELEAASVALAAEIAGNAPLSLQGNKQVIDALLRRRARSTRATSASWSRCAARAFAPRTSARGCGPSARSARRAGRAVSGRSALLARRADQDLVDRDVLGLDERVDDRAGDVLGLEHLPICSRMRSIASMTRAARCGPAARCRRSRARRSSRARRRAATSWRRPSENAVTPNLVML